MTEKELKRSFPNASPDFIRRNAESLVPEVSSICAPAIRMEPTSPEAKLNKLEREYLAWLKTLGDRWIGTQCITLQIGFDCRFTPDFWALDERGRLRAIDVKGFQREDALIKIRVAARMYPWVHFVIAKKNRKVWEHTEVKP